MRRRSSERVASFSALLYNFLSFKKRFRLKKETKMSLQTKKQKREATVAALATFLTRMSKSENILLNCLDQDQNSLDKYF